MSAVSSHLNVERSAKPGGHHLRELDYAILQQCMHCGMCLPTCPTYDATHLEKNSPRGRISLMRAIADEKLEMTPAIAEEMYYCLGCLACQTACPAGVDYAHLFEVARAEAHESGVLESPQRRLSHALLLRGLFTRPRLLRLVGRCMWLYQASGAQWIFRTLGLNKLLPKRMRDLESQTPTARAKFSHQLIQPMERPDAPASPAYRVGFLTGCVQDIVFSDINRDTVDVLLANGCEVQTPAVQPCCGSLHAHNGEIGIATMLARRQLDLFDVENLDAIITNAAGCGSHLKTYGRLLQDDPTYSGRARLWDAKLKDIHEWLAEIGFRKPEDAGTSVNATYHEACHLCHGQKITKQPRDILKSIPGLALKELPESMWCCGSAGIYNITQPETSAELKSRKVKNILATKAEVVATANPGCHLQLQHGLKQAGCSARVAHPISLLAEAYRKDRKK